MSEREHRQEAAEEVQGAAGAKRGIRETLRPTPGTRREMSAADTRQVIANAAIMDTWDVCSKIPLDVFEDHWRVNVSTVIFRLHVFLYDAPNGPTRTQRGGGDRGGSAIWNENPSQDLQSRRQTRSREQTGTQSLQNDCQHPAARFFPLNAAGINH